MENLVLRRIAELSDNTIEFKDEAILPGTAWIGGMPIDISIEDGKVTLNSVGKFSGDCKSLGKGEWRGKGKFKSLVPHIKQALTEQGLSPELYLLPLSPVWKNNYTLVECSVEDSFKIVL